MIAQQELLKKSNRMGTTLNKTSKKTKTEMAWPSRRESKEDESEKLEREM
jgi:CRISPR/Cas system CMR-associated protein Cmr3 (group 5 of RAMP superfamily)